MFRKGRLHWLMDKEYIVKHPEDMKKHLILYTGHELCFWLVAMLAAWFICYLFVSFLG